MYADLESTVRLKVIIASICAEAVALVDSQKSSCVHSATASVAVLSTHLLVSRGGLALARCELVSATCTGSLFFVLNLIPRIFNMTLPIQFGAAKHQHCLFHCLTKMVGQLACTALLEGADFGEDQNVFIAGSTVVTPCCAFDHSSRQEHVHWT